MKNLLLVVALLVALPLAAQDTATLEGEPAIRFLVGHGHLRTYCDGQLWITPTRVRFDGVQTPAHSFDLKRGEVTDFNPSQALGFAYVKISGGGENYRMGFYPDLARQFGDRLEFAARAWKDFQGAYAAVRKAEAQRKLPAGIVKASVGKDGPMLEFPIIAGPGIIWFKSDKKVTVWEGPQADGSAYVWIQGGFARGKLQVTADRVRFVSANLPTDPDLILDSNKEEMRIRFGAGGYPHIIANFRQPGRVSLLFGEFTSEPIGSGKKAGVRKNFYDATPLLRALGPEFPQMAAELLPKAVLVVASRPGAEVFVDGQRRGVISADGTLRITALAPGDHPLRATLAGYQPWSGTVALVGGDERRVDAPLAAVAQPAAPAKPAGPAALALKDVVAMLQGGVSTKRVAVLVQERGVDFPLDDAAEKQVRSAGGDAELLVVIAKAKK